MRILITHNTYQQAGHEVELYTVSNHDIKGLGKTLKILLSFM